MTAERVAEFSCAKTKKRDSGRPLSHTGTYIAEHLWPRAKSQEPKAEVLDIPATMVENELQFIAIQPTAGGF
jgi:hypothetical protein